MFTAFIRRQSVDELRQYKLAHINALYANSNYDSKEINRQNMVAEMEDNFTQAVNSIYGYAQPEIDLSDNPFFAAIRVPTIDTSDAENAEVEKFLAPLMPSDIEIDQPF